MNAHSVNLKPSTGFSVNNHVDRITKSLGLCAQLAYGTVNCIKRLSLGIIAGGVINSGVLDDSDLSMQLIHSFVGGIALGILKESKVGLIGSIGCHIANNIIALSSDLRC